MELPAGLTSVGDYFLCDCWEMASLTLPAGLTGAGIRFLSGCKRLQELTVLAATPPVLGSEGAFAGVDNTIPVYVPAGSTDAYAMADGWNYFTDYRDAGSSGIDTPSLASGTCGAGAGGSNLTWTLTEDSTLTITGKGDMADFTSGNQPWEDHLAAIRTAVVQEGVTSVGNYFLSNCTGLTSIDLPDGLTSVGSFFLSNCTGLTSIDLPAGLTRAGGYFLYGCIKLTSL